MLTNTKLLILFLLLPISVQAHLWMAGFFSDRMLVQRDQALCVWGKAALANRVTVSFGKDQQSPLAKRDSSFRVCPGATKVKAAPMELLVVSGGYADSRATILFRFAGDGPKTEDESDLQGFSLDGTNEAKALCRGAELIIEDSGKPECVYYGWNPFSDGNLVNSENLPASTFRIRVK